MDKETAFQLAEAFIREGNMLAAKERKKDYYPRDWPHFDSALGEMTEFTDCYYFESLIVDLDGKPFKEPPIFGGAPGFAISKSDGSAKIIAYGDLGDLHRKEEEMDELYALMIGLKSGGSLHVLKGRYNLSTHQLLKIKGEIQSLDFSRENCGELLWQLIQFS